MQKQGGSFSGREAFLISGVTTAFLEPSGTSPSLSEKLTNLVIDGRRMSMHSLIRNVGKGDLLIIFAISS